MAKYIGFLVVAALLILTFSVAAAQDAPLVLQDFEGEVELVDVYQATATIADVANSGVGSLASTSEEGEWHTVGASFTGAPVDISGYNQICFSINDTTAGDNTVGFKLFDASGANVERWTDAEGVGVNPKTVSNEWTQMCLALATFTDIDLTQVTGVEIAMYAAGVYYFDDIIAQNGEIVLPEPPVIDELGPMSLTVVQDFESEDTYYSDYQADVSLSTDVVFEGSSSLMAASESGEWHAFGAYPSERPFDASGFDALCFQIYDTSTLSDTGPANATVGVSLFDVNEVKEEVWTDHLAAGTNPKTGYEEWTQMCIKLSAFTTVDLTQIDKIQFALYWAGTYYVDNIAFGKELTRGEQMTLTTVQGFEAEETYYSDYQADLSLSTEIVHEGASSLMVASESGEWHAFGAYPSERPLDVSGYDALCFWIYDTSTLSDTGPANATVGVSLIDVNEVKDEVWTDHLAAGGNPTTQFEEWTQMCINLDAYLVADLTQIDRIQLVVYWAGTYYVDDIAFGVLNPTE